MCHILPKCDTEMSVCANIMGIMAYSYAFSSPPACKSSVSPPSKPIRDHLLFLSCSIALDIAFFLATILTSLSNTERGALASLNISSQSAFSLLVHIFKILHKDDTLSWSGRSMDLNTYFILPFGHEMVLYILIN